MSTANEHLPSVSDPALDPSAMPPSQPDRRPRKRFRAWLAQLPFFRTRLRAVFTVILLLLLFACLGYWLLGVLAFGDNASLIALKGLVQTRREDEPQWIPAHLNQLLSRDSRVRTGDSSSARLVFFDITTADLGENTEVSSMRLAKRRGGDAVDVVIKTWVGKTVVRAVRFLDPSSSFRLETPTSSTVVRGARFTIEVAKDGTTQIDLEEGSAQVMVQEQVVALNMGERITINPAGKYETVRVFQPDPQRVVERVQDAWNAPGGEFTLELPEAEVNEFLSAMSQDPSFFLRDVQIWLLDGRANVAATVARPIRLHLSASIGIEVEEGRLRPRLESIAPGLVLPVPEPVLDRALQLVLEQLDQYLVQAYSFVEFSSVEIKDGVLIVTGTKRSDAPMIE
jgi:hypothetical protein